MRILITGGTGFLGRKVVERLERQDHQVTVLVRPSSSRAGFPAAVTFAVGDVTDPASLRAAAHGHDAILHGAALVKIAAPGDEFDRVNVQGLENVLRVAEDCRVERVLYVSSFMALGPSEDAPGGTHDETSPADDRDWINHYERTKTVADRRARRAIRHGAPVTVVYPGVIYGPGELTEGNIVVRHVIDLVHGRLPALLGKARRRWNYVFVDDVAEGIVRALTAVPPGRRYVLGGDNVTQDEFYRLVGELTGARVPTLRMPDPLGKVAGAFEKAWAAVQGRTPKLTPDLVDVYRHDWALDSSRAREELAYRPRPLAEGLAQTVAWLQRSDEWPA